MNKWHSNIVIICNVPHFWMRQQGIITPTAVMRQEERESLPLCLCPSSCNLYALLNFLSSHVLVAGGGSGWTWGWMPGLEPCGDVCEVPGAQLNGTGFDWAHGCVHCSFWCFCPWVVPGESQVTGSIEGANSPLDDSGVLMVFPLHPKLRLTKKPIKGQALKK